VTCVINRAFPTLLLDISCVPYPYLANVLVLLNNIGFALLSPQLDAKFGFRPAPGAVLTRNPSVGASSLTRTHSNTGLSVAPSELTAFAAALARSLAPAPSRSSRASACL
jgi:hypothetical protein